VGGAARSRAPLKPVAVPEAFVFVVPEEERYGSARGGAIATCIREMTRELVSAGSAVRVITPRSSDAVHGEGDVVELPRSGDPKSMPERLLRGVLGRVRPRRWGSRARYVADTRAAIRAEECVVVSNDPPLASVLAEDGLTVVLWVHNYLSGVAGESLRELPPGVRIAAVSDSVREWTMDVGGIEAARIVTIHNGVNHRMFHPAPRTANAAAPVRVIVPGRIDPNKGQLLAIRAVAETQRRGVGGIELSIMGAVQTFGHQADAVSAYERELQATGREVGAIFLGRVDTDRVGGVLRSSDIALVLPLVPEPFGLAALEAMASGCAIIAVAAGGSAEVLGDAAVLVEPDVDQVAGALQRLVEDRALREDMSRRAVAASQRFVWAESAARLRTMIRGADVDVGR
jgi:glycosyltransferase involved in cell wall biosynthesis